jgi:diguanylate cyclase (GGDEF)-like protein/PAS domain S-box-containing protein
MISLSRSIITKVVLYYALFAAGWIALSDRLLLLVFRDPATLALAGTFKGWVFVAVTAGALGWWMRRALADFERQQSLFRASEVRFHNVFNALSDAIFIQHPFTGVILDVNARCIELYGYSREEFRKLDIGQLSAGYLPYTQAEAQCWVLKASTQGPQHFDWLARNRAGNLFWVEVMLRQVLLDGEAVVLVTVHDIGERKHLEQKIRRRQALSAMLSGANQAFVHATQRQDLFEQICRVMMKTGLFRMVWIGSVGDNLTRHVLPLAWAGDGEDFLDQLASDTWADLIELGSPTGMAVAEHRAVICNDFSVTDMPKVGQDRSVTLYGLYSAMVLPISGGGFSGTLSVYAGEKDFFDEEVASVLKEMTSELSFALKHLHDIEIQASTLEQLKLHARVFDESRDGIVVTDSSNNIVLINRAMTALFGYVLDEVQGQNPRLFRSGRHGPAFYRELWDALASEGHWQGEIWNRRKDGELFPCWAKIYAIYDEDGQLANYFEVFGDLAERKAQEELQWLKRFDAVTRLPNRLLLEDRAGEAIAHARQTGHRVALLSVNLDRFHHVNESLGHHTGDKILQMMGERFRLAVGERGTVSRLSGGAFVVLQPEIHDSGEAVIMANRVLKAASQVYEMDGTRVSQTPCIGIAIFPEDGDSFVALLSHADEARIEAVEQGGNHYRFYSKALNANALQRLSLAAELHQALENGWFELCYQPQVDAISNALTGVEALLRLHHPERGMISPVDFIHEAEETGLIIPIGAWVIRTACEQLMRWLHLGPISMAINLSALQLQDELLFDTLHQVLEETRIDPHQLEFEVTEGALMRNSIAMLGVMQRLKALGVRLAIDDFGTGYTSLSYLKQFPIDRIKIDKSFVMGIPNDPNSVTIVQAILALSRAMGISTIAEGVETANQADHLRLSQCDELQGYHVARPAPACDMGAWIEGHRHAQTH